MAMIHEITGSVGKYKKRKRIGRGPGSGHGKTSGRGHKGAKSRSGWSSRAGYQGGATPYFQRIPKVGFTNARFKKEYATVNIGALEVRFNDGDEITPEIMTKAGLIAKRGLPIKVLGDGELTKKLVIHAAKFSASAKEKIEKAGGSATASE